MTKSIAVAVVCFVAGFGIGRIASPSKTGGERTVSPNSTTDTSATALAFQESTTSDHATDAASDITTLTADDAKAKIQQGAFDEDELAAAIRFEDIEDVLSWLDALPVPDAHNPLHAAILRRWLRETPEQTLAYVERIPNVDRKQQVLQWCLKTWSGMDWPSAAQWALRQPTGHTRHVALTTLSATADRVAPEKALATAKAFPRDLELVLDQSVFCAWFETDAKSAQAAFALLDPMAQFAVFHGVRWANVSVDVARVILQKMPNSEIKRRKLQEMFANWAKTDWDGALTSITTSDDTALQTLVLPELMKTWVQRDVSRAAEWVVSVKDPDLKHHLAADLLNAWLARDDHEPVEWAKNTADPGLRNGLLVNLCNWFAQRDPKRAIEIAAYLPSTMTAAHGKTMARAYAEVDPPAAAAWVGALPDDDARAALIGPVMRMWALRDFDAAGAWVQRLAPGQLRDAALTGFGIAVATQDPAKALQWVYAIGDEQQRVQATIKVVETWRRFDEDAALKWAKFSWLPVDARNQIDGTARAIPVGEVGD